MLYIMYKLGLHMWLEKGNTTVMIYLNNVRNAYECWSVFSEAYNDNKSVFKKGINFAVTKEKTVIANLIDIWFVRISWIHSTR